MTMLDQETVVGHVYEAFSILSDAQELLPLRQVADANEMIAHAKKHLGVVLAAAPDAMLAVVSTRLGCTLQ